jgi:hypothetical protein
MRREDDDLNAARGCVIALSWCGVFWLVLFLSFVFG